MFLLVTTPSRRTSSGSRGSAMLTRFCTSTCAVSRSVPSANVTVIVVRPSAVDCEERYSIFSTPLISCSSGAATVAAAVSAFAPGYDAVTVMLGGATSGYCETGSAK